MRRHATDQQERDFAFPAVAAIPDDTKPDASAATEQEAEDKVWSVCVRACVYVYVYEFKHSVYEYAFTCAYATCADLY